MKPVSLGVIGLGGVAQAHLRAIAMTEGVTLRAVCDVRPEVAIEVAGRFGTMAHQDYREVVGCGADLVLVLTPASTHREIVLAAARAGTNVFCEKPLAVSVADAEAMVEGCRNAKVSLFYGASYRHLPAVRTARDLIADGAIGRVQLMTEQVVGGRGAERYTELSPIHYPLGGPGGPGMGLVDHGIHLIDAFSWFAQSEVVDVQGRGLISGRGSGSEFMAMHFANGALGMLTYNAATYSAGLPNEGIFSGGQGWLADGSIAQSGIWENEPGSICVYGTKGALRIYHYANALFLNDGSGPRRIELSGRPAFGHFATQLEECLGAIRDRRLPAVSGADGLRVLRILMQVYDKQTQSP